MKDARSGNAGRGGTGNVLDISRLLSRLHRKAPTGIDRVELAYARHHLEAALPRGTRFLLTTPVNTALLPHALARDLIRTAIARWSPPAGDPLDDPAYASLCSILREPVRPDFAHRTVNATQARRDLADGRVTVAKVAGYVSATVRGVAGPHFGLQGNRPWYLHVSHMNLHHQPRLAWLRKAGWRGMFLVHDLIPISHPEYFLPEEDERHRRRIETVARMADMVIFNSAATKAAWDDHVAQSGLPRPRGEVVPLGVEEVFHARKGRGADLDTPIPYFVVVGTMEARKNLTFLLQVWRQWTCNGQRPLAHLVIVGRRGWESENVFDLLDRSAALAPTVVEVAELGDVAMAALMRGARALLAPSLIEGFGLPIAEALSLGVPVVASDIDAHREVGGAFADYVDPIDGPGWLAALEDYVQDCSPRRLQQIRLAETYRPLTWDAHIGTVLEILDSPTECAILRRNSAT